MSERQPPAPGEPPAETPPARDPGPEKPPIRDPGPHKTPIRDPAPEKPPVEDPDPDPDPDAPPVRDPGSKPPIGDPAPEKPPVIDPPPAGTPPPPARVAAWDEGRPQVVEIPRRRLRAQTRRDFIGFGVGVAAAATGAWWLLPDRTKARIAPGAARRGLDRVWAAVGLTPDRRERTLDLAIEFDDRVAETLHSRHRPVRTYRTSEVTALRNNYHGRTPGPEILPGWKLNVSGLASGHTEQLDLAALGRFAHHEQVTRLVCVEGWSAIAWWGGLRFADLIAAFPPAHGSRWAALRSTVSLDGRGRPELYYVSIDLETALHPQTLLATEHDGRPLSLAHGAPLRLLAPTKLGLKNIKGLTDVVYTAGEPPDYWHERGYSSFDGL